jgi:hypothetical protein
MATVALFLSSFLASGAAHAGLGASIEIEEGHPTLIRTRTPGPALDGLGAAFEDLLDQLARRLGVDRAESPSETVFRVVVRGPTRLSQVDSTGDRT